MSTKPRLNTILIMYDEKYGVLTDYGGLLFPVREIPLLEACIAEHKKHGALELEAIARRLVEERYPSMLDQVNWDNFK